MFLRRAILVCAGALCAVWPTPKEPQVCLAAHNLFQHKGPWATDEIVRSRQLVFHSTCDVRAHFVGAQRTMTPPSSTPRHAACVFLLFADRVCTAMPALPPSRTPPYRAHSCHGLRLPLSFRAQRFLDAPAHAQAHPDRAAIPLLVCLWY